MRPRHLGPVFLLVVLSLSSLMPAAGDGPALPEPSRAWLDDVGPLMTARERDVYISLRTEEERQAFVAGFWQARDPYPLTPVNELREQWESRLPEARRRWGGLTDDRARAFLLQGDATASFQADCPGAGSYEVWLYEPHFREKYRTVLVFLRAGDGVKLWHFGAPGFDPAAGRQAGCTHGDELAREAQWIRWAGKDGYEGLLERALARPRPREWLSTFAPPLTFAAMDGAPSFDARLDVELAGRWQDKVVVRVLLAVDPGSLPPVHSATVRPATMRQEANEFLLAGRVLLAGQSFESFLYRFHSHPRAAVAGRSIPLTFERYLPPGQYTLDLKLEHVPSQSLFQARKEIAVPDLVTAGTAGAPAERTGLAALYAEADAALSARPAALRLLAPPGALLSGPVRFEARVDGAPGAATAIARVAFVLDGKLLLTRSRPPYELNVDLGSVPRPRRLAAEGLDSAGQVVARDEILVNGGAQALRVRLREPQPGRTYSRSVRPVVDVEAPAGEQVARVDLYLGEERIATLYQPPYVQPVLLAAEGQVDYLRAVATLANGSTAEDVVLINAPARPDAIDVRLVELYATVVDAQGRPLAAGLDAGAFRVAEDGMAQQIRQVDTVAETPLRLVTLIDSSGSMVPRMAATRQAAAEFLRHVLHGRDQAALIAFSRSPRVIVPLTGDLGALEDGLAGVMAEDETALWDSLIYSLFYLDGAPGQRAVLLLSDGLDLTSRFSFEQAVECARRAGVAIYAIGLALGQGARSEAAERLAYLAAVTGGRAFFAATTAELAGVYGQIEQELRARWRIAYQSSNTKTDGAFRSVQVKLAKSGLEARTISGYYP